MKTGFRGRLLCCLILLPMLQLTGQTVTELVIPKYFGSKTAASANSARTAFSVCFRIDGLSPNTTYDVRPGLGLTSEASTSYGAGNYWNGTTFSGTTSILNCFTTDAAGSSGPVWIFIQPTGNATRFDAGQVHNLRLGWITAGGTMPSSPIFTGSKTLTALDIAATPRTTVTTDDGCFIKGSSMGASNGKYMLIYDNEAGSGDPLFSYQVLPSTPTQSANTELPVAINDVYMQTGTSLPGDYPAVVPIGANNPNGVRRVESRNADNTVFAYNTCSNGTWPSGANSTTALRRDVVILTNSDTPLSPSGPGLPTVSTGSAITNISFNSATGTGNVTNTGGSAVTARGLCWNTSPNPSIAGNHTTETGGLGTFTSNMTGLLPSTIYYVRAYATNTTGTAYGANVTFSTLCDIMPPLPNFSASKVNLSVGESINFFDSTKFCPESWEWSFVGGNPSSSTVQNPTGITYNFAGDYNVCLTATNQWGQQTTCKTAYIHVTGPTNAPIVMTEINYRSPIVGTDSLEFIEIYNNGTAPVNMLNFNFSRGVEFTFPQVTINPGAYMMVGKSAAWLQNTYGVQAFQWNTGSALTNQGEAIVIKDLFGYVVDSVYYLPTLPWDTMANGKGPSLELCDPSSNNLLPQNWRHAVEYKAKTPAGDSLFASPLAGCGYLPVAGFTVSDSTISVGQSVVFTDASTGGVTSWFWEFERGTPETYSGQNPPPVQYNVMGNYDVTLTVSNATGQNKKYKPLFMQVGPVGISDNTGILGTIYPTDLIGGNLNIDIQGDKNYELSIYDITGKPVLTKNNLSTQNHFNISSWHKGIYLVRLTDPFSGQSQITRIIIH